MEIRFGGINTVTRVQFGLHTRHRAYCLHHLVKYIQNNHLEGKGGGGGLGRGREEEEGGGRGRGREEKRKEGGGKWGDNKLKVHECATIICYCITGRYVELSQTSNPFAFGSNSTEVPLNTTFMTNPGNIPTTALPCMECGGVKVGRDLGYLYRWFSWGVAALPEGKEFGSAFGAVVYKYREESAVLSPCHQC